jgi:hypothetical protein
MRSGVPKRRERRHEKGGARHQSDEREVKSGDKKNVEVSAGRRRGNKAQRPRQSRKIPQCAGVKGRLGDREWPKKTMITFQNISLCCMKGTAKNRGRGRRPTHPPLCFNSSAY